MQQVPDHEPVEGDKVNVNASRSGRDQAHLKIIQLVVSAFGWQ